MKRSTALIRPSRTATQHSFTWRSHRIGTACELTRWLAERLRSMALPSIAHGNNLFSFDDDSIHPRTLRNSVVPFGIESLYKIPEPSTIPLSFGLGAVPSIPANGPFDTVGE